MSELAEQVRAERAESHSLELDIDIAGVRLSGWLHQVQDDGLLRWRPATLSAVDGILLWLEHLVYCCAGGTGESRMYGRKNSAWRFAALAPEEAQAQLAELLAGYQRGLESAAAVAEQERLGVAKSVLSAGNAGNRLGGRSAN